MDQEHVKKSEISPGKQKQQLNNPYSHHSLLLYDIFMLQRTIGNQEVQRIFKENKIMAKLFLNQSGDIYEQEADRIAREIVNMQDIEIQHRSGGKRVQKKEGFPGGEGISSHTETGINALKGKGQPLSPSIKDYLQPRFGVDLDDVRIHTNSNADKLARAIRARAFTLGNDVAFAKGEYQPDTKEGKKLIAHELTHVLQQSRGQTVQREQKDREEEFSFLKLLGITQRDIPLYDLPDRATEPGATVPFNTTVYILKQDSQGWAYVLTETGETGYAPAAFIWTGLPEPTAKLHKVKSGETARDIAHHYYSDRFDDSYGRGIRYFIEVLYLVNSKNGNRAVYRDSKEKNYLARHENWKSVKLKAGSFIWIPGKDYAYLYENISGGGISSGSISYDYLIDNRSVGVIHDMIPVIASLYNNWDLVEQAASLSCEKYMWEAVKTYAVATPMMVAKGMLDFLQKAAIIMAVSTTLGAIGGALFTGGEGAIPGAWVGMKIGIFLLQLLGLGYLVGFIGQSFLSLADTFNKFLVALLRAKDDKLYLDEAARELADGIGQIAGLIIVGLIIYLLHKGLKGAKKAFEKFKASSLGKVLIERVGESKVGEWFTRLGQSKQFEWMKEQKALGDEYYELLKQYVRTRNFSIYKGKTPPNNLAGRAKAARQSLPNKLRKKGNVGVMDLKIGNKSYDLKAHSSITWKNSIWGERFGNDFVLAKESRLFKTKGVRGARNTFDRFRCAEAKLFEEITVRIKPYVKTNTKVRIDLFTEQFPCESCLGIARQFSEMFKQMNIDINIYSGN